MKILLIDDDRFLTQSLKNSLENRSYETTVFNKAGDFIKNLHTVKEYDLVLLDLMMRKPPDLVVKPKEETGEALFKKIREANKDIPVVIITGKSKDEIETNFDRFNVPVLFKPLRPKLEDLYEVIENAYAH